MGRNLLRRKDLIHLQKSSRTLILTALFALCSLLYPQDTTQPPAAQKKVLTRIGGIQVPKTEYAQTMIHKYISQYTSNFGKKQLYETLDKGEIYRLYVRQELKKRRMPEALEYLPLVESEFNPLATSRSGARGMWQFMENSIKPFLKKTEWLDERLDPWLSTDAALTKLQDNYRMFGDWPIAIAAYNCGAGAMKKILKTSKQKSFWYISEKGLLRDQSVQYVPKFLAISELSVNGAEYGVELPEITKSPRYAEFDYIPVSRSVNLELLESEMRMEKGTLRKLNPALIKGLTPPDSEYRIRLPLGMGKSAEIALGMLRSSSAAPSKAYTVVRGDTLYSIARRNGITVSELCAANSITQNEVLSVGKILHIPVK